MSALLPLLLLISSFCCSFLFTVLDFNMLHLCTSYAYCVMRWSIHTYMIVHFLYCCFMLTTWVETSCMCWTLVADDSDSDLPSAGDAVFYSVTNQPLQFREMQSHASLAGFYFSFLLTRDSSCCDFKLVSGQNCG